VVAKDQRLQSGLGIHREAGLTELQIRHDLPAHQFEVVREITKVPQEKQPR
jgi:hypothetical protein